MDELVEFLTARLSEDEAVIRAAATRKGAEEWRWYASENDAELIPDPFSEEFVGESIEEYKVSLRSIAEFPTNSVGPLPVFVLAYAEEVPAATGVYMTRFDASRMLAEVTAKRRIVELTVQMRQAAGQAPIEEQIGAHDGPAAARWRVLHGVLRFFALPYADHPDYDERWRV